MWASVGIQPLIRRERERAVRTNNLLFVAIPTVTNSLITSCRVVPCRVFVREFKFLCRLFVIYILKSIVCDMLLRPQTPPPPPPDQQQQQIGFIVVVVVAQPSCRV